MFYVTATDKFLSGWGKADGKTNKIVVEVETWEQAKKVYEKLLNRHEMKYVRIAKVMPYYRASAFYVSMYSIKNNSDWIN